MEILQGGRDNSIFRSENKVYRPRGKWSETVHRLLLHIAAEGFTSAPRPYGFDDNNNEILSYVCGDVVNYPLKGNIATTEALITAAKLLRRYHDASSSFLSKHTFEKLEWMLPRKEPAEVICHGDYAPYNVSLVGSQVVGIIDFDTAHPAPRTWDIAYALYCWAPFKTHEHDAMGDIASQSLRAKQFCDAYGLSLGARNPLVMEMIERVQALIDHMHNQANLGHEAFIQNIEDGHHLAYMADIEYLESNAQYITEILMAETSI